MANKNSTVVTLALGGDKAAGKTSIVDYILMPALGALGGIIVNRNEDSKKNTETVTFSIPAGALQKLFEASECGRIGMDNIREVYEMADRRAQLQDFLGDTEISGEALKKTLPRALQGIEPEALKEVLHTEARRALAAIEANLAAVGFDLGALDAG